jgi:hypothetical protein
MSNELLDLMTEVAHHLNQDAPMFNHTQWDARPNHEYSVKLVADDGRQILVLNWPYHPDRLELSGWYPHDERSQPFVSYHEDPPKITVSQSRPPAQIAGDVLRRLLPRYTELYRVALERQQEHERWLARRSASVDALLEAFGGHARHDEEVHFGSVLQDTPHGRAQVFGDGTCKLELERLPVEKAVQIAEILYSTDERS